MKPKSKRSLGKSYDKLDSKERSFLKNYGEFHPINEIDESLNRKVQIVKDDNDDYDFKRNKKLKTEQKPEPSVDEENEEEVGEDFVVPYKKLLNDLISDSSLKKQDLKQKLLKESQEKKKKNKKAIRKEKNDSESNAHIEKDYEEDDNDESDLENNESNEEDERNETAVTYAQEVLCKDNLENEELIQQDPFHNHFEINLEDKQASKLKENLSNKQKLDGLQQKLKWPALGDLIYSPLLEEKKVHLDMNKDISNLFIKQRILERLNESVDKILGKNHFLDEETDLIDENMSGLNTRQKEILNIISNYVDFYHSNLSVKHDAETKYVYTIHALNHALKTRSRIIAHNDKLKQNKSNPEIEYRDQGLTRPKVLILVPFRKSALKIIKIIISLLMRKNEEFVSNKKRFFDGFGPDENDEEENRNEDDKKEDENKKERPEDFNLLFSGNVEDHFKIGLSVSKKSLKLYTEFYSSDIIIASPLGLKTVIGSEGDAQRDHDFLSSIELLIVDNADVLMMQNWEHVQTIFDNLHLQPKKSHDVDFSRVRSWLLDGHARHYRQTIVFSRIPAPPINSIFNKYCQNYAGKCQLNLIESTRFQIGTICKINFQLSQMFHRIECDSPLELPDVRFNFFVEKILPQFKDDMMSHTLIFISSYFDFVKLRNYFKKNDLSFMFLSEYNDNKSTDRARYLFYHGRVHFMLVTERFHFYKRYRIRGINHLIFYDLPHYAEFYSNFSNYLPDVKRKNTGLETFSCTALYSKFDAQKLCAIVGKQRATHMINSEKNVHMFMTEN